MTTVGDVVNDVIRELSQVPGQATQIYSTPRMTQHVQDAFLLELEEEWWPELMMYQDVAIDPTSGLPVDDIKGNISFVDEWHDIAAVWPAESQKAFPAFPRNANPHAMTGETRYVSPAVSITSFNVFHRPFLVWPPSDITVTVYARQRPTLPMILDDNIYLDRLLLMYDACWMYAVDDGTIPAQVNKFQTLAVARRKRIKAMYNNHALLLDSRMGTIPNQWMEAWC